MMKIVGACVGAAALATTASAVPRINVGEFAVALTPVFDGCGPYGHRGPYGSCRPGGQAGGYVRGVSCPAGWHIEPHGRFCLLNRGPILGPSTEGLF